MSLGVDTTDYLNQINWPDFYNWKGQYPIFAGRYFGGGYTWSGSEFTEAKASTGGKLTSIAPIRASTLDQSVSGSAGYNNGVNDGNDTCTRISNAINAGQLTVPPSGLIVVYLDNEPIGSSQNLLTADYWAGWANTVFNFPSEGAPYYPGLYCPFYQDSSGVYVPISGVQTALNDACSKYPSDYVVCWGLWTFEPHSPDSDYCPPGSTLNWSLTGKFNQDVCGNSVHVPVYLWQYASPTACSGYSNFAGGQDLDIDGSDSTGAESYMLKIA